MSYRTTDHYNGYFLRNRRVLNDLSLRDTGQDAVQSATPLTVAEKRNPREYDIAARPGQEAKSLRAFSTPRMSVS